MSGVFAKIGWKSRIKPRMGKSSAEERFTLLFVSARGRSSSLGFSRRTLRVLGWLSLVALCTLFVFVSVYRANRRELLELRYMRDVADSQREQIRSLQEQFSVLMERLRQAEIVEGQIREMLSEEGILPQASITGGSGVAVSASRMSSLSSRHVSSSSRLFEAEDLGRELYVLSAGVQELASRAVDVEAKVVALREEAAKIVAIARATPSLWPVSGEISSDFGWRINPFNYNSKEFHEGVDIAAQWWEPIIAAADGTVTFSGYKYGYGWTIVLKHEYGFETLYAHCCRLAVKWGENVTRGDVIGYVGQSGSATGPHLHYEVRVWGTPVDPVRYLPDKVMEVSHSVR